MSEFERILDEIQEMIYSEVEAAVEEAGEAAVEYNVKNGDYRNRTGRLRRSNYYEVLKNGRRIVGLRVGNHASYASNVESRGRMVASGGALLAEKMLK